MLPAILAAVSAGTAVAGALRKTPMQGYSKGDLDWLAAQRANEIDSFASQLASLRQRYASQLATFGTNTFNRFSPAAEASYAGKGFAPNGGAFQSALAKKAAEIQDAETLSLFNQENSDIRAVDSARGNLRSAQLGGGFSNFESPAPDPIGNMLGAISSATGTLAGAKYGSTSSGSGALAAPSQFGSALARRRSLYAGRSTNLDYRG